MEMSGKESQALMKLEAATREAPPHQAYEFEMLLVETLIYQVFLFFSPQHNLKFKCH